MTERSASREIEPGTRASLTLSRNKALAAVLIGIAAGCTGWLIVPGPTAWACLPLALGLSWASFVDIDRFVLPDAITLGLVLAGLLLHASDGSTALLDASIGAAAGYAAPAALAHVYERVRQRPGLGLGDAKLLAAAGAWLGWKALPVVVLLGALAALGLVICLAAMRGRDILGHAFPFGPFLAAAYFAIWLAQPWPFG